MSDNLETSRTALSSQLVRKDIDAMLADHNEDPSVRFEREVLEPIKAGIIEALRVSNTVEEAEKNVLGAIPVGRKYEKLLVRFSPQNTDSDGDGVSAEGDVEVSLENDAGEYVLLSTGRIIF